MSDKYVLVGKKAVKWDGSFEDWCMQVIGHQHHVAYTDFKDGYVSTIFLGLANPIFGGPPRVFETMIFGGAEHGYQVRTSTWNEAEEAHGVAVAIATGTSVRIR